MESHQQRVVNECSELKDKAEKLSKFIGDSDIFPTLDPEEQELLKEQCETMWEYFEILEKRIAKFNS